MAEAARWYVVHTYSGYENKVKASLEKVIENRGMQDYFFDIIIPMMEDVEIKDGKESSAIRKIFPGYVLIKMILTDDTWYVIRNTRGVTGFVGPGSRPTPLTEEEVAALDIEQVQQVKQLSMKTVSTAHQFSLRLMLLRKLRVVLQMLASSTSQWLTQ